MLNPSSILIDFEKAVNNAINNVFSQTLVKCCHVYFAQNVWKKVKNKYNLVKLSKQEHIRHQIDNIISLLMILQDEVNHCMGQIIDKLRNVHSKFDKLTDYISNNYIEDVYFPFHIWNHFDSIGERRRVVQTMI